MSSGPSTDPASLELQCVFCGEGIEDGEYDPCAVALIAKWKLAEQARSQYFFCHSTCFQQAAKTYPDIDLLRPEFWAEEEPGD